jgi:hypothetical protein
MATVKYNHTSEFADFIEVRIDVRILGFDAAKLLLRAPAGELSLWDLIRLKARQEWEALESGEDTDVVRESLPPQALQEGMSRPESLEEALRWALDGYRSGWYIVLIDGEEPGGLDARFALRPDSRVAFVRMYPLPDRGSAQARG